MRIWDIDAGFLNDQSLLGEHGELHGIVSILRNKKTGYSRHPETIRWDSHIKSLLIRHEMLVEEMSLRGMNHYSPIEEERGPLSWPDVYIDDPARQYEILQARYKDKKYGRIPLPKNIEELWACHKYSLMARDPELSHKIGASVARGQVRFRELSIALVEILRTPPLPGRLENALHHMWGYVSSYTHEIPAENDAGQWLREIGRLSETHQIKYLRHSTALGELRFWCRQFEGRSS